MSMVDKQNRFTGMIAKLIIFAQDNGYQITFGEAFRTKEQAVLNQKSGKGISKSLHTERLAVDFNLFKNGEWLTKTTDHKQLGEYWESIGGSWGGRFNDGNHYSLEHNGVR
ncbi:MAG: M15 family metallopeptidase [Providencia heimbachae]|nr:M15 family metallopeptidase [Providencia heimbachae]